MPRRKQEEAATPVPITRVAAGDSSEWKGRELGRVSFRVAALDGDPDTIDRSQDPRALHNNILRGPIDWDEDGMTGRRREHGSYHTNWAVEPPPLQPPVARRVLSQNGCIAVVVDLGDSGTVIFGEATHRQLASRMSEYGRYVASAILPSLRDISPQCALDAEKAFLAALKDVAECVDDADAYFVEAWQEKVVRHWPTECAA